jgi:hypothetical protein
MTLFVVIWCCVATVKAEMNGQIAASTLGPLADRT